MSSTGSGNVGNGAGDYGGSREPGHRQWAAHGWGEDASVQRDSILEGTNWECCKRRVDQMS